MSDGGILEVNIEEISPDLYLTHFVEGCKICFFCSVCQKFEALVSIWIFSFGRQKVMELRVVLYR